MVGIAAGEAKDPKKVIPKAVNAVAWRIGLFYCGSVLLLVMVLPWTAYGPDESPFVVVFSRLGVPVAGDVMNLVVITAALSSVNSGLYSTGRILRTMATDRQAPRFSAYLSGSGVPAGAIALTGIIYLFGVILNYLVPEQAFEIAISIACLGTIITWGSFLVAHLGMRRRVSAGELEPQKFRMPFAPWSNYLTLAFLVLVVVLLGFSDDIAGKVALASIPVLVVGLWLGWRAVSKRAAKRLAAVVENPEG